MSKKNKNPFVQGISFLCESGKIIKGYASIDAFKDGQIYELPRIEFSVEDSMAYSKVSLMDNIVIKVPTYNGFSEFREGVSSTQRGGNEIEGAKIFKDYTKLLDHYPEFGSQGHTFGGLKLHYLLAHKLNFTLLFQQNSVEIPDAKFVFVVKKVFGVLSIWQPAIIQHKISGILLWDMFEHERRTFLPKFRQYRKIIASRLLPLADSELASTINWNIKNFIYNPDSEDLFYVDSKPAFMIDTERNIQNLSNLKKDFS